MISSWAVSTTLQHNFGPFLTDSAGQKTDIAVEAQRKPTRVEDVRVTDLGHERSLYPVPGRAKVAGPVTCRDAQ